MKIIVGLGNPGRQYERTRHNAGYMVVERLARRHAPDAVAQARFDAVVLDVLIAGQRCLLVRPTTFMNRSGRCVGDMTHFYRLDPRTDLLIIVDDLYLPPGTIRLRPGGGTGGHQGLTDIERALGTDQYPRLRIGIGTPPPDVDHADYVLRPFEAEQWSAIEPALERAADAVEVFVTHGLEAAMNRFNAPGPVARREMAEGGNPATTPPRPPSAPAPPPRMSDP